MVFAQIKDLTINGDNVSYDKVKQIVEASGSVEVLYRDVKINGNHILYDTAHDTAHAEGGFVIDYEGITMEGLTLNYAVENKTGSASDVVFTYKGIELSGGKIDFASELFKLKDASFTTCSLLPPHYHVTARDINFYPNYGWMVAYWGFFWVGGVPLVPMPTYIYDMLADEKNQPPFPEIGSNDEDGMFINEKLAWHLKRELSGTYTLSWAAKKGGGLGVSSDYIANDVNRGNARLSWNGVDHFQGGITHHYYFGPTVSALRENKFSILPLNKVKQYEIEAILSSRERINYQKISYLPRIDWRGKKMLFVRQDIQLDADIFAAKVEEEGNTELMEGAANLTLNWDLPEIAIGDPTPFLSLDNRYYSCGTSWERYLGGIEIRKKLHPTVSFGLSYAHFFSVLGQSPFNFEMYRFRAADRIVSDVNFVVGETGISLLASYFTDNWQPEDIDGALFFRMHCYNLMAKYRSMRREFQVGFTLVEE